MLQKVSGGEADDPIGQALGYLDRLRQGGLRTHKGRPIEGAADARGYCYVLCDLTPQMKKRCERWDLTETPDGLRHFGYHKAFKAYIEVLSFDGLLRSARQRNRAFFDKLGLPTN